MNITKKIVAIVTVLTCTVMMVGFTTPTQAAISAGCRADISTCSAAELTEYITELSTIVQQLNTRYQQLIGAPAAGVTGCTITSFAQNLKQGMTGDDVKCPDYFEFCD